MILSPQTPTLATTTNGRRKVTWIPSPNQNLEEYKIEIVDFSQMGGLTVGDAQILEIIPSPSTEEIVSTSEANIRLSISSDDSGCGNPRPRKRARLDHLSAEQKSQHRKMMNRISAQSARDRQRALMKQQDDLLKSLNSTVEQLKEENQNLRKTNELLVKENSSLKTLVEENQDLKTSVQKLENKLKELTSETLMSRKFDQESERSLVPAVPTISPLPKGLGLKLFLVLHLMNLCLRSISSLQKSSKPLKNFQKKSLIRTRSLVLLKKLLPIIAKELDSLYRSRKAISNWNVKKIRPP